MCLWSSSIMMCLTRVCDDDKGNARTTTKAWKNIRWWHCSHVWQMLLLSTTLLTFAWFLLVVSQWILSLKLACLPLQCDTKAGGTNGITRMANLDRQTWGEEKVETPHIDYLIICALKILFSKWIEFHFLSSWWCLVGRYITRKLSVIAFSQGLYHIVWHQDHENWSSFWWYRMHKKSRYGSHSFL